MEGSKNLITDALSCLDKNENKVKLNQNSQSKNFTITDKEILHLPNFETIIRLQQKYNLLIRKVRE